MMHLVTGHAGIEHIKPSDDGAFNAGVVGTGKYVFDLGKKFSYEIVSNNLVKILDGELINQGRHANIPINNYEEVTIENGLQGVKRYDLICARYTKNADTSIESADLVVVKGTSSTTPSDPACVEGNILEGALIDDFPLYRVRIDGLNIVGVDCLFEVIPSIETINNRLKSMEITYQLIDNNTYDWRVYNPDLFVKDGVAHLSFRLQTPEKHTFPLATWTPVMQLSVKPKSQRYGVVNTFRPKTERFSAYIDTNGLLHINPNTDVTDNVVLDIMCTFRVAE
jgi:hypothetical protein